METNARLSTRRTKTLVTLKHNPSHVRRHTLLSQPSQHLITQFRLNTHNLSRVLQHPKQTQYSKLQIKLSIKTPFDYRHLTTSSFYLYLPLNLARGLTTLSEETTQRTRTYHLPRLPTTKPLAKITSPRQNPVRNGDLVNEQQPSDSKIQPLQHAALRTLSIPTRKKKPAKH